MNSCMNPFMLPRIYIRYWILAKTFRIFQLTCYLVYFSISYLHYYRANFYELCSFTHCLYIFIHEIEKNTFFKKKKKKNRNKINQRKKIPVLIYVLKTSPFDDSIGNYLFIFFPKHRWDERQSIFNLISRLCSTFFYF